MRFTESWIFRVIPCLGAEYYGISWDPQELVQIDGPGGLSRTLLFHWYYKVFPRVEAPWGRVGAQFMLLTDLTGRFLNPRAFTRIPGIWGEFT